MKLKTDPNQNRVLENVVTSLKYNGIDINTTDFEMFIDAYLRIITTIVNNDCDNTTGLNIAFTDLQGIEFGSMREDGIESIRNYIRNLTIQPSGIDNCVNWLSPYAKACINDPDYTVRFLNTMKSVQVFVRMIIGYGEEYISGTSANSHMVYQFSGKYVKFTGYLNKNNEIEFTVTSNAFFPVNQDTIANPVFVGSL